MLKLLHAIASLRLTVALFGCAIFIIMAGTVAQIDQSLWNVLEKYFRAWYAWIELGIFFPRSWDVPGGFFFPGGWLISVGMLINLLSAHALRFKITARGSRLGVGLLITGLGIGLTAWVILRGTQVDMTEKVLDSYWRILYQLLQGGVAGLVLLIGSIMLFRKRAGIVLLHGGIILIIVSELFTGTFAVESSLTLREGETAAFIDATGKYELAIIDESNPNFNEVTVIPSKILKNAGTVSDDQLPVDIEILQWWDNTTPWIDTRRAARVSPDPRVDHGVGRVITVQPQDSTAGVQGASLDAPAAIVRFMNKQTNKPVGTYLVSLWFDANFNRRSLDGRQTIHLGDRPYTISLRSRREYLSTSEAGERYTIKLEDFSHDLYPGTTRPKNFSSDILLNDPAKGIVDRPIRIWMNNPMRYGGQTFYQSAFLANDAGTVLQVVRNPGWMTPYVACMIVSTGLLWLFCSNLFGFIRKRKKTAGTVLAKNLATQTAASTKMGRFDLLVIYAVVVISGTWLIYKAMEPPAKLGQMNLQAFGQLPVMYEGRLQPIDSLARNSLRVLSDHETFTDANGDKQPAVRWLLDAITGQDRTHRVLRIDSLDLLQMLGLEKQKGFRYAISDLSESGLQQVRKQFQAAVSKPKELRDRLDKQVIHFYHTQLGLRYNLSAANRLLPPQQIGDKAQLMQMFNQLDQQPLPQMVPPTSSQEMWRSMIKAGIDSIDQEQVSPQLQGIENIYIAYAQKKADVFNQAVAQQQLDLLKNRPTHYEPNKIRVEAWYNHFGPFYLCTVLYVFAFIITAIGWLVKPTTCNRAAMTLLLITWIVHTIGIILRIYISGRPPVTNLYSSAVFIGWGCVGASLLLERLYRNGAGNTVAAVSGFITLLIGYFLTSSGDTFAVLQAVLDTNFWLATHVVCITLGYAATFLAGLFAIIYVIRGVFTASLDEHTEHELSRMIYGSVCFALLFSFVGTVLGGLWADDSWGRFWGWDTKENGALIIVLWNALILHARWSGLAKRRGVAVLAVAGNIVTAWSWFGVNQLGVGLHSYGFTDSATTWLLIFVNSQIVLIALGIMPLRFWQSRRGEGYGR